MALKLLFSNKQIFNELWIFCQKGSVYPILIFYFKWTLVGWMAIEYNGEICFGCSCSPSCVPDSPVTVSIK